MGRVASSPSSSSPLPPSVMASDGAGNPYPAAGPPPGVPVAIPLQTPLFAMAASSSDLTVRVEVDITLRLEHGQTVASATRAAVGALSSILSKGNDGLVKATIMTKIDSDSDSNDEPAPKPSDDDRDDEPRPKSKSKAAAKKRPASSSGRR